MPDFGMYRVKPETATGYAELRGHVKEMDSDDIDEMMHDVAPGYHEIRTTHKYSDCLLGMVIGENPDARVPEYDPEHWSLKPEHKRIVRWSRAADSPQFGDVILFRQNTAVDWMGFWQMPCDTTPACEFLLCSQDGQRWAKVHRQTADITTVDLDSVLGVVAPFGAAIANTPTT